VSCADDWWDAQLDDLDEPEPDVEPLEGPHRWVRGIWRPIDDHPGIDQYQPNT